MWTTPLKNHTLLKWVRFIVGHDIKGAAGLKPTFQFHVAHF